MNKIIKALVTPRNLKILSGILTIVATQVAGYVAGKQQEEIINAKIEEKLNERVITLTERRSN